MKYYRIGVLFSAILMLMAGVGIGIAQAWGNHSDSPVLNFQDQEALGQDTSSSLYVADLVETGSMPEPNSAEGVQLASEGQEFVPEGNWSGSDWQAREPVGTGSLPEENNSGSSIVETEGNMHRAGEDSGGP